MTPNMFRLLPLAVAGLAASACDSDHHTLVDLSIEQQTSIVYGDENTPFPVDDPHVAVIPFDDLRSESRYVDLRRHLRCAGLDPSLSYIEIRTLDSVQSPLPFLYSLEVAPAGTTNFVPLADFDGLVAERDLYTLADPEFTVHQAGRDLIADLALSDKPAWDVRVTGELTSFSADYMLVDVLLDIELSSDTRACP